MSEQEKTITININIGFNEEYISDISDESDESDLSDTSYYCENTNEQKNINIKCTYT